MKYTTESFPRTQERKFEEEVQFQLMDGWVALVAAVGEEEVLAERISHEAAVKALLQ